MKPLLLISILSLLLGNGIAQSSEGSNFDSDRHQVFKVDFFSPLSGNLTFSYEKILSDGISFETKIGLIGIGGTINNENALGVFIKTGPKFTPLWNADTKKRFACLRGYFYKPELVVSVFKTTHRTRSFQNETEIITQVKKTNYAAALMLNVGRQYMLGSTFTLEWYFGFGLGIGSDRVPEPTCGKSKPCSYYYSHFGCGALATSLGISLGFVAK